MTNTLLAIATRRPLGAKYVIWSRIDQKTCVKCITAANLELVSVEQQWNPESCELQTNVQDIQHAIERLGPDRVACVVSTTSCFAPRNPDQIEVIAKLCDSIGVPHLINNAYGVQAKAICDDVTKAWRRGRVDAVVQSTDKNFMVPVGGSIVCEGLCCMSLH
jgi:O-phospho-L-seryl-tRNASec:L-selenocysteinyl-tRNA synthase